LLLIINSKTLKKEFNSPTSSIFHGTNHTVYCFDAQQRNIDPLVVESFGHEWSKFHNFDDQEIERLGKMYFDVLDDNIINKNTYVLDVGCGNQAIRKNIFELFKRRTLVTLKNIIIK